MSQVQEQNVDLNAILKEVAGEVDELIKSEQARLDSLKKNEESSMKKEESSMKKEESSMKKEESSMKKEESSMKKEESSMKKDEGSGFESPTPEASASSSPAPADPSAQASPEADAGDSLESMVHGLDDEMLHELMQCVQMEMEARSKSAAPAPMESAPAASPSPSPAASSAMKSEESSAMYKKEMDAMKEKLSKSEENAKNLEKAVGTLTDLMEKMVNRPVTKAVTDIRSVDYVDKGEKDLKKTEQENISDEEFHKRAKKIAGDRSALGALTKNERDALSNYFVTKKRSSEVLKLISK